MKRNKMRVRKISKMIFNKKAVSLVASAVILTGVAISLGFVVLFWGQSMSSDYARNYGQITDAEIAKLKEKLTAEYVFYNSTSKSIRIFMLNAGAINNITIQSVYVRNSTWNKVTSSPSLKFFNGTVIPDQDLDMGEEGYVDIALSPIALTASKYYSVRIVTGRGSIFEADFIA